MSHIKLVDEYLSDIDYEFKGYIPKKEALMFVDFIQKMNQGGEENETPLVHLKMMDTVFNKEHRVAVLCHRGIGKTALFAEYLILFIASYGYMPGFGKVDLMLYISDSIENGVKNLRRNVEFRYANSEFLAGLIPNRKITVGGKFVTGRHNPDDVDLNELDTAGGHKFTDIRLEFENYRGDRLVVKGYGAKTGVRGAKEMGQRPTLAVFDDIVSDMDAESPTVIGTIENTVYKAVSKALHPTRQKMVWLGTPFNESDPLYKAVESGAWNVACFPIAEDFDSMTTEETFKGSWDERFTYEYVKREFDEAMKTGRPQDFYQELMLRISSEEERLIPESNIVWFGERNYILKHKEDYNWYIFTDAATSENKKADYSVVTVWAVNNNGDIMLIDGWHDRVLFNKFIDKLFSFAEIYKTNLMGVGVENSSTQKAFLDVIQQAQIRRNSYFHLLSNKTEPGLFPIGDKFQRFLAVQPRFAAHKIWFPSDIKNEPLMIELLNELKGVSRTNTNPKKLGKARHDDVLDTISQIGMIDIIIPSVGIDAKHQVKEDGVWYNDIEDEEELDSYSV